MLHDIKLRNGAAVRIKTVPRGVLPYKMTGVLVVPFRGLNSWLGTA